MPVCVQPSLYSFSWPSCWENVNASHLHVLASHCARFLPLPPQYLTSPRLPVTSFLPPWHPCHCFFLQPDFSAGTFFLGLVHSCCCLKMACCILISVPSAWACWTLCDLQTQPPPGHLACSSKTCLNCKPSIASPPSPPPPHTPASPPVFHFLARRVPTFIELFDSSLSFCMAS
jgi:hypothetical protein